MVARWLMFVTRRQKTLKAKIARSTLLLTIALLVARRMKLCALDMQMLLDARPLTCARQRPRTRAENFVLRPLCVILIAKQMKFLAQVGWTSTGVRNKMNVIQWAEIIKEIYAKLIVLVSATKTKYFVPVN